MKRILTFIMLLLAFSQLNAQTHEECGTDQRHKFLMNTDPVYKADFEKQQQRVRETLRTSNGRTATVSYKIPVVVHVLHLGTGVGIGENISDEQVYSAIDYMNKAYAHVAPYNQGTQGVSLGVEFCLVQKDPNGNPTSGIDRVDMSANSDYVANGMTTANELSLKTSLRWNTSKFYNIYIVTEIDNNGGGSGVQGYAYFPTSSVKDGAVILYNSFGYDVGGLNGYNLKSYTRNNGTATHEIGHALGLYHTFEGDNNGTVCPDDFDCTIDGDEICDTPPHIRTNSTCGTGTNSCTGGSMDLYIHNFMDYSSEVCKYEFTAGQAARMQATLASSPYRTTLVSAANITACGCDGDFPIVRYKASKTTPCPGEAITFTDLSIDFPATWSWTFPGGTPSTSTAQNPTVVYNTGGSYNVSLTVNSAQGGGRTLTKSAYIAPKTGQAPPLTEDFTSPVFLPSGWTITNPDAGKTWERVLVDNGTNYAVRVDNYMYSASGQVDQIISPFLDLTNANSAVLTFRLANKMYGPGNYDTLKVVVLNCSGTTGTVVYSKWASALQTSVTGSNTFVPVSSADWRTETIDLSAFIGQSVYISFRNITDFGNDTYIDDINLTTTTTGTQTAIAAADASLYVYPNPASSTLFTVADDSKFDKVQIVNMQGVVMLEQPINASTGTIDISGLMSGVYLARFTGDQHSEVRRFTIMR
jgi:PKD repeat protein